MVKSNAVGSLLQTKLAISEKRESNLTRNDSPNVLTSTTQISTFYYSFVDGTRVDFLGSLEVDLPPRVPFFDTPVSHPTTEPPVENSIPPLWLGLQRHLL
jgi:hypothetical protein